MTPSSTGGGAEERYEKMQRESDAWSARVQASIDALTEDDQTDWQALAGELANHLTRRRFGEVSRDDMDREAETLVCYHTAIERG
jgi:hypothetical protein